MRNNLNFYLILFNLNFLLKWNFAQKKTCKLFFNSAICLLIGTSHSLSWGKFKQQQLFTMKRIMFSTIHYEALFSFGQCWHKSFAQKFKTNHFSNQYWIKVARSVNFHQLLTIDVINFYLFDLCLSSLQSRDTRCRSKHFVLWRISCSCFWWDCAKRQTTQSSTERESKWFNDSVTSQQTVWLQCLFVYLRRKINCRHEKRSMA